MSYGPVRLVLAGLTGRHRAICVSHRVRRQGCCAAVPLPRGITPRREVQLVGVLVLVLILVIAVTLPI